MPDSTAMVISDENNREDICKFIEWRIGEKMRERQLTEKKGGLRDIKSKLNKADCMLVQHLLRTANSRITNVQEGFYG